MKTVAFFSMLADGHMGRLLPLIAGVAARGHRALVFSHGRFESAVTRAGGRLVDMFGRHPLEDADPGSFPIGMRSVAYAARYAGDIERELQAVGANLVVYDTFAMVGRVAAARLGLPYVNVCAGHNVAPARFQAELAADPRVVVSDQCRAAVTTLRDRYGMADASPYSYVAGLSPWLNLYGEPPEFLTAEERQVFEPVAFFGSLPDPADLAAREAVPPGPRFDAGHPGLRVYVSFGTVVWRSYPGEALAALRTICEAIAGRQDLQAVVSLGGASREPDAERALAAPNVAVHPFVDQWAVLREADVFITHHGLNSTHEAIHHGVPMISYPFFWDQPGLARKCQDLGLALPLSAKPRGPVNTTDVNAVLDAVLARRGAMARSLAVARGYESGVMAGREAVLDRLLALG